MADLRASITRHSRWPVQSLLTLGGCLLILAAAAWLLYSDLVRYRTWQRGRESGLAARQPALMQPRFGVNVALEQYDSSALRQALGQMHALGVRTIRQRFAWAELEPRPGEYRWDFCDDRLRGVAEHGLQVIAVLDTSPAWAREAWEQDNPWAPPARIEDYARFVEAFAQRYGEQVVAYQIWDQPNIAPHWGNGEIKPAEYVQMLRQANAAIRRVKPEALIIAGGLAPNTEGGGRNMSDVLYLREIYRRGAGAYFDVLGVHAYGFWSGPDDRRVDAGVLNFSRAILLREEMVRRGDSPKPVWALDGGWCALPQDWRGAPAPQGSDLPLVQVQRLERAMARAQQEWPWMTLLCLAHWQPDVAPIDPLWGYALVDSGGQPTALCNALRTHLNNASQPVFFPGVAHGPFDGVANDGHWLLRFWGTDLVLRVDGDALQAPLSYSLDDGLPQEISISRDGSTRALSIRRLRPKEHRVQIWADDLPRAALLAVQVGSQADPWKLYASLAAGLSIMVWSAYQGLRAANSLPWRQAWQAIQQRWDRMPHAVRSALMAVLSVVVLGAPNQPLRLGALLLYGVCAVLQPDMALLAAVLSIPLAPLHIRLGPGSFSLTEIAVLAAFGAYVASRWLGQAIDWRPKVWIARLGQWGALDWLVLGLAAWGLASCFWAEYQRVAFREWRLVILEPALLYLLLRQANRSAGMRLALVDGLWVASVGVALYALARYPTAAGVIEAEGVRRARAFFGSPNNLALYLERTLPLGLALVAWGQGRWRRWLYGVSALAMGGALLLTFSRGAWLLGIPALALMMAWIRGGRVRWVALGVLAMGVLLAIPLLGAERLSSLLDTSQGTTFLRVSLWQAALDMLRDHPWLGVGLDNFLYYYGDYIRPGAEVDRWLSHPHNLALDFWLRLGVGGALWLLSVLALFLRRALAAYRRAPDANTRAITLALIGGMAAFVVHGLIDSSYFVTELAHWFMFALAWAATAHPRE